MARLAERRYRRAVTITEVMVAAGVLLAVVATLVPMLGSGMLRSGMMVSAKNLRTIAAGCSAYEADWNGRVWNTMDPAMGNHPNGCTGYTQMRCPPQLMLGNDSNGGLWGYWIRGGPSQCANFPGNCGNWPLIMPMALGGSTGSIETNPGLGMWQLPNARGLREYVTGRFFDPVFYSPNDTVTYGRLQASSFGSTAEFDSAPIISGDFDFTSTYGLSPAATWGVGVLRAPSEGGFRSPDSFPDAYEAPSANLAVHPSLKTRIMEKRWCQQPPALGTDGTAASQPYRFNAGGGSRPGAVFFDGHVSFAAMADYASDDELSRKGGGDGLWSRDTPYGEAGVWGSQSIGQFYASPHLLTTDGIAGRDLTTAR